MFQIGSKFDVDLDTSTDEVYLEEMYSWNYDTGLKRQSTYGMARGSILDGFTLEDPITVKGVFEDELDLTSYLPVKPGSDSNAEMEAKFAYNIEAGITLKKLKWQLDYDLTGFKGMKTHVDLEEHIGSEFNLTVEGDISKCIAAIFNRPIRENKIDFKLLGLHAEFQGVEMEDSAVVGAVGYTIGTPPATILAPVIDVDNVIAPEKEDEGLLDSVEFAPTIFIPLIIDCGGQGKAELKFEFEKTWTQRFGDEIDENGNFINLTEELKDEHTEDTDNTDLSVKLGVNVEGELNMGPAIGVGFSVFHVTPVLGKAGAVLTGNLKGSFSMDENTKSIEDMHLEGDADLAAKRYCSGTIRAIGKIHFTEDLGGELEIDATFSKDFYFLYLKYPMKEATVEINEETELSASSFLGASISSQFLGYDKEKKVVKPIFDSNGLYWGYQCPRYIHKTVTVDDEEKLYVHKVTKVQVKNTNCSRFDLSRALDVVNVYVDTVPLEVLSLGGNENLTTVTIKHAPIKTLDISKNPNVTEINNVDCYKLEAFVGNGKAFPINLRWYSDEAKTIEVTSCEAGQTVYSELYGGVIEWQEMDLDLNPEEFKNLALIALDEFGNDISEQFSGYNADTNTVGVKDMGDGLYSFQCPQYIYYEEEGVENPYRVITGLRLEGDYSYVSKTGDRIPCGELDLELMTKLETLELNYLDNLKTLKIPEDNVITSFRVTDNSQWIANLDFSRLDNVEGLELERVSISKIGLENNSKLITLYMDGVYDVEEIILPKSSKLKYFIWLRGGGDITEIDLSKQTKLIELTLPGIQLEHLDVSKCVQMDSEPNFHNGFDITALSPYLKTFIGNGMVFPEKSNGVWNWYSDSAKLFAITKEEYLGHNFMIYSDKYEAPQATALTLRASSLVSVETSSDAETEEDMPITEIATSSNAVMAETPEKVEIASDSNAMAAD